MVIRTRLVNGTRFTLEHTDYGYGVRVDGQLVYSSAYYQDAHAAYIDLIQKILKKTRDTGLELLW